MLEKIEARLRKEVERILAKEELTREDYEILSREYFRLRPPIYGFCCETGSEVEV